MSFAPRSAGWAPTTLTRDFRSPEAEQAKGAGAARRATDNRRPGHPSPSRTGTNRPDSQLSYTENMLYVSFGEVPEPAIVHAFEIAMVLYADHGFSASTFATRVATSTLSDLY